MLRLAPDAIIVVGYGRIIPQWMIDLPPLGNLNLHASLLPKYRGAAPIQWAIARGESVTGVTTMRIDAGLDTGDILLQKEIPIAPEDTAVTLAPRMAAIGADLMVETLRGLQAGTIHPRPQDMPKQRLAPILKKEDGKIDFQLTAQEILNRLRGFQPWPGAYTSFRGKNLHIWAAQPIERAVAAAEILVESGHLIVGCGAEARCNCSKCNSKARNECRRPTSSTAINRAPARSWATENRELITDNWAFRNPCPLLPPAPRLSTSCFGSSSRMPTRPSYCTRANTPKLSSADHGLTTELVMGVLRWRSLLDAEIGRFSDKRVEKLDLEVLTALRLAAYQLLFLDRVPGRAAVHESVELVKRARKGSAAPFANAVLRKLAAKSQL